MVAKAKNNDQPTGNDAADKPVDPVPYTASYDTYYEGKYVKAGEVFVTSADKQDDWVQIDPKNLPAIEASTNKVPNDVSFDNLDVSALQALAAAKNVSVIGIEGDKDKLITAIKAANEPHL
jgi:hypothetical protein